MEDAKRIARAKNNAYALLRLRPRSEKELTARLTGKGYGEAVVDTVVADLKKKGLLDDAKFARFWVESRMHLKPVGDVVLRHELKAKGVPAAVIEATLSSKEREYDEYEVARSMAVEKFKRLKSIERRKAVKRVYDFLLRRGFKYDVIRRVVEEILDLRLEEGQEG